MSWQDVTLARMCRWMEREYGHHVAQSLPAESDTGASAKKLMDEGSLPAFTLEDVRLFPPPGQHFVGFFNVPSYASGKCLQRTGRGC